MNTLLDRFLPLFSPALVAITLLSPSALRAQDFYVANGASNTVAEYDATTGAAIAGFTSPGGVGIPYRLALSGNDLYVTNIGEVGEYDATTGAAVTSFISPVGLSGPAGIVVTPEPGSSTFLGLGLPVLLGIGRRRRRAGSTR